MRHGCLIFILMTFVWSGLRAAAATQPSSAQACVTRSIYATGKAYLVMAKSGDVIATVHANTAADLAAAFEKLVTGGRCLPNPSTCSLSESTYTLTSKGFQRYFNVLDEENQVLAVFAVGKSQDPNAKFLTLVNAGICTGPGT